MRPFELRGARGWRLSWTGTRIMGIVNATPDSFSDGGRYVSSDAAIAHGRLLAAQGALIVDVGGESTRPGSQPVPIDVEIDRARPVVAALAADGLVVSIDTRHAEVAAAAIAAGARLVNDISGLADPAMVEVCASTGTAAVINHMQGTPATMQNDPRYDDVVREVTEFLVTQSAMAVAAGVPSVIVDPGIGFGKTLDDNLALLRTLPLSVDHPVLIGASRKGLIGQLAGPSTPDQRDAGTLAIHLFATQRGAALVRAHDVAGHTQALAVDHTLRA